MATAWRRGSRLIDKHAYIHTYIYSDKQTDYHHYLKQRVRLSATQKHNTAISTLIVFGFSPHILVRLLVGPARRGPSSPSSYRSNSTQQEEEKKGACVRACKESASKNGGACGCFIVKILERVLRWESAALCLMYDTSLGVLLFPRHGLPANKKVQRDELQW